MRWFIVKPQDEVLLELLSAGLEGAGNYITPNINGEGLLYPRVDSIVGSKICWLVSKEKRKWTVVTS